METGHGMPSKYKMPNPVTPFAVKAAVTQVAPVRKKTRDDRLAKPWADGSEGRRRNQMQALEPEGVQSRAPCVAVKPWNSTLQCHLMCSTCQAMPGNRKVNERLAYKPQDMLQKKGRHEHDATQ
jgi:hypothetical protein